MKIPYTTTTPDPETAIVLEVGKQYGIDEALLIYTSKVDIREWAALRCKYGCKSYGKSHSCPPHSIPIETTRNLLKEYKRAVLVAGQAKTPEDEAKFRKAMIEMENALYLKNYYRAFALVPGCCTNCEVCTAEKGGKCKSPESRRPCIDGTGIDVFALIRKHKKSIQTVDEKIKSGECCGLILLD